MIVTTAGHVDHGKTSLIRALTDIDTDVLPEEKRRGMTIDLGFAYLPVPALAGRNIDPIGFVDVPGHQRFIHNMLSGVGGSDCALLVVAADDGPMPQTIEHLEIIDLLRIRSGLVALTKADRVSSSRITQVTDEIVTLLHGTSMQGSPIIPVSAIHRSGTDHLRDLLLKLAREQNSPPAQGYFRLSVDRCFIVPGTGVVATGTALSGQLSVGETVELCGSRKSSRVRSISAQNRRKTQCVAGQRCAINLRGLNKEDIRRGDWIVAPGLTETSARFDVRIRVSRYEARSLSSSAVHLHIGAGHMVARMSVLGEKSIASGESGYARMAVDRPICVAHGDRFILRDNSAQRVIGGGRIIDIAPPLRGRARPERLAALRALEIEDPAGSLEKLLDCTNGGVDLAAFSANRNLTDAESGAVFEHVSMVRVDTVGEPIAFSPDRWMRIRACALQSITRWHDQAPSDIGIAIHRLFDDSEIRLPRDIVTAIAAKLSGEGDVIRIGMFVRLPSHEPKSDPDDQLLWSRVRPLLEARVVRPPTVAEISYTVRDFEPRQIEAMLKRTAQRGCLLQVSKNRFFLREGLARLCRLLCELVDESPEGLVTAAQFRDRSGLGRNLSIEVLEYFDRIKFTRRKKDGRVVSPNPFDFV